MLRRKQQQQRQHDEMPLNPLGRGISETKDKRGRLLSCKQTLKIAVMNVQTIRQKDKRN